MKIKFIGERDNLTKGKIYTILDRIDWNSFMVIDDNGEADILHEKDTKIERERV